MLLAIVLIIINIYILLNTREPKNFRDVKERYRTLREHLANHEKPEFRKLSQEITLVAHQEQYFRTLGYNTNKGYEIGLCIDGSPNEIMHVLLHELAHSTVPEYSHSHNFWEKTDELKKIANEIGVYTPINNKTRFCKAVIQDN